MSPMKTSQLLASRSPSGQDSLVLECKKKKKTGNETVEKEIPILLKKKKKRTKKDLWLLCFYFSAFWPEISSFMSMSNERTLVIITPTLNSQNRIKETIDKL